jgi:hypothetical protein
MKKGDVVLGPTVEELSKVFVCHKRIDDYHMLCGDETIPCLSHTNWEKVTCPQCKRLWQDVENERVATEEIGG